MVYRGHWRFDCKVCGRERAEDERFSARGKCSACGIGHMRENAMQLHEHDGHWFDHWRQRVAASVGATLLDDL